jgi:hypothetical protein
MAIRLDVVALEGWLGGEMGALPAQVFTGFIHVQLRWDALREAE